MDKREFIKKACSMGLCSCAAPLFLKAQSNDENTDPELAKLKDQNWRL